MPNEGCLEGMRCPSCKSEGPFKIWTSTWMQFNDEGEDFLNDKGTSQEWNDQSGCQCAECDHHAKVWDFMITSQVPAEAIDALLDYNWDDESKDFDGWIEENPGETGHVFQRMEEIREWLDAVKEKGGVCGPEGDS